MPFNRNKNMRNPEQLPEPPEETPSNKNPGEESDIYKPTKTESGEYGAIKPGDIKISKEALEAKSHEAIEAKNTDTLEEDIIQLHKGTDRIEKLNDEIAILNEEITILDKQLTPSIKAVSKREKILKLESERIILQEKRDKLIEEKKEQKKVNTAKEKTITRILGGKKAA
jgi:hypothetical protein